MGRKVARRCSLGNRAGVPSGLASTNEAPATTPSTVARLPTDRGGVIGDFWSLTQQAGARQRGGRLDAGSQVVFCTRKLKVPVALSRRTSICHIPATPTVVVASLSAATSS